MSLFVHRVADDVRVAADRTELHLRRLYSFVFTLISRVSVIPFKRIFSCEQLRKFNILRHYRTNTEMCN